MSVKKRKFKTEVQQLLDIVIHSLYSNRDIFLRELISNASDAIDRARFEALSDESVLENDPNWKIKIHPDKDARTITISDNGIGMSAEEVEKNIGTIASSGTRNFMEQLQQHKDSVAPELIGQFGVGFYSAFMVADKVTLITRRPGDPASGVLWESEGAGSYTLAEVVKEKRGTDVILHLKEGMEEYLEEWKIRKIVKQFSDFVEHPVVMDVTREKVETDDEGKPIESAEKEKVVEEEQLNSGKAIWQRPRNEISQEEYNEFYKLIAHDYQEPLETMHWQAEGKTEFRTLLFIPSRTPFGFFTPEDRQRGIHLYVKRVFITDNCEALAPQYLRFLRGVVDSSDLPLNISRELLQEDRLIRLIRKNLVKKVLDTLADMKEKNREKYIQFWKEFGAVLKEGMHLDMENREKLQELLVYETSKTKPGEYVTLDEYVKRMPEKQKDIYYITAESRQAAENSPHLEALQTCDYEVLFMTDPIDEWVVQNLMNYQEKQLKSIAKGDIDLSADSEEAEAKKEKEQELEKEHEDLIKQIKDVLGDKVKEVRLSHRLIESACCLVAEEYGMGVHMEKILKAMHQEVPPARRILELNPNHDAVKAMQRMSESEAEKETLTEYAELMYDQALLTAGLPIEDPLKFSRRVSQLMASQA